MAIDMKSIIAETFVGLVKQKGIDKVTVPALIDACHISRQTFYYHFQDLMDVINWSAQKLMQDILARSIEKETPEEALHIFISSILEERELIRRLLDSQRRPELEHLFFLTARSFFEEILKVKNPDISINYADFEVALDFWSFGITGIIFRNLDKKQVNAEKLAQQICRFVRSRR